MNYKVGDKVVCIDKELKVTPLTAKGLAWKPGKEFVIAECKNIIDVQTSFPVQALYEDRMGGYCVYSDWVKLIDPLDEEVKNIKEEIGL